MPKYKRIMGVLRDDLYFDVFEEKGEKFLKIHRTTSLKGLRGKSIPLRSRHVWTKTDKLHKLAQQYYNNNSYWWVIALFNKKPTDAHYKIGDTVYIPDNPVFIKDLIEMPETFEGNAR